MKSQPSKLDRRQFLKLAGATGAIAIPALLGYDLLRDAKGELPPRVSPYAPTKVMNGWPSLPVEASPILLLINQDAENPFGAYLAEMLAAEGLNSFQVARMSDLGNAPLDWYDLVILAEGPLNNSQVELLENYVAKGGRLVAMRPDVRLAFLFGIERVAGDTAEGYLQIEAGHPIGRGLTNEALQFHGVADHYRLAGAQAVAWLDSGPEVREEYPAVTLYDFGQGQAALWAFDLARSVAYTRQGNPAWANQERDGGDGVRAPDMFKDWVDLDRIGIPQADMQQRLLASLLATLSQDARPLPRLWYFPGEAETMLIATGDSHGNPASAIEDVLRRVEQRGGHFSVYYTAFPNCACRRAVKKNVLWASERPVLGRFLADQATSPSSSHVADWRERGHEFGMHPYVGDYGVEPGLESGWHRYWEEFTGMGYGPVPPTTRTHRILWTGWTETARVQASYGMRMNLDYYQWGPGFQNEAGTWTNGHFTGSGLPMRFVDKQGRILNIYQQLTQLADDHLLDLHWGGVARLGSEAALEMSQELVRRSLDGDFSAIACNFHVDPFAIGGEWVAEATRWLEGTLDFAMVHGVPIWSGVRWLQFTEVRHDAGIENVQWQPGARRLSFDLVARNAPDVALTVMVPLLHGEDKLTRVEINGLAVEHSTREVGGVNYGWVSVPAGSHQVVSTYAQSA